MSTTNLEHKTVRPGNLVGYSYYHSARTPDQQQKISPNKKRHNLAFLVISTLIAIAGISLLVSITSKNAKPSPTNPSSNLPKISTVSPAVNALNTTNQCKSNQTGQFIKVSINERRLWACEANKQVYTSSVITGITTHPETLTPPGTYKIYSKQTNIVLSGSDSTGTWSDPVSYWMPFLTNQYGTYGFHDATWRPNTAFGNISPNSADASHGCVELPISSSQWLYNWAQVGTTVSIVS